jgi:hypothetical protein
MTQTWVSSFHRAGSVGVFLPVITTTNPLPNVTVGVAYSAPLSAIGGVPPFTWSIASQTSTFNVYSISGQALICAAPGNVGTDTVVLSVKDSVGNITNPPRSFSVTAISGASISNPVGIHYAAGGGGASLSYEDFPGWLNRVRESRGFQNTAFAVPATLSAAGWPVGDFGCLLHEGNNSQTWMQLGTGVFNCGFIGTGNEVIAGATGQTTIANVVHGTGGAYTTFTLEATTSLFGFTVTNTGGATTTNVFAYLPGYAGANVIDDPTNAAYITADAKAFYPQFRYIRMSLMQNPSLNSTLTTSANRHTPSNTQANNGIFSGAFQISFTSTLAEGATSATLEDPWPYASGGYGLGFTNYEDNRLCTMVQGQTTCTWTPGLTLAEGDTATFSEEGYPIEWLCNMVVAGGTGGWFNMPPWEDGSNGGAGSYSTAALTVINNTVVPTGKPVFIEIGNEIWNSGFPTGIINSGTIGALAFQYGFATSLSDYEGMYRYMGFRLYALSQICASVFGSNFGPGKQVQIVFAWQGGNGSLTDTCQTVLNYIQSTYGTVNAVVQNLAIAPYLSTSSGITLDTGDSIATIQSKISANGPIAPYSYLSENFFVLAKSFGMGAACYECGLQTDVWSSAGIVNLGASILDPGMNAAMQPYWQELQNAGYTVFGNYTGGISSGNNAYAPGDELDTVYANRNNSPRLLALQTAMTYAPKRNLITGPGWSIPGYMYADNTTLVNPTLAGFPYNQAPFPNFTTGYVGWHVYCTVASTYTLFVTATAAGTTNVYVNSTTPVLTGQALINGKASIGSITLPIGHNFILLGVPNTAQSGVTITALSDH